MMNARAAFMKAAQAQALQGKPFKREKLPSTPSKRAGKNPPQDGHQLRPAIPISRGKDLALLHAHLYEKHHKKKQNATPEAAAPLLEEPLVAKTTPQDGQAGTALVLKRNKSFTEGPKTELPSPPKKARISCGDGKMVAKVENLPIKPDEAPSVDLSFEDPLVKAEDFISEANSFILDASEKAARHNRKFRQLIRDTSTILVRVRALHRLVIAQAARKEQDVEDRIFFSMEDSQVQREIFCPEENLPAFSPSARVAFKPKPIPLRLNPHVSRTYEKRKLVLKVYKGSKRGRHILLFSCAITATAIARKAAELAKNEAGGSPSIFLPVAPTKYVKNCQVEFEVTGQAFDARHQETKISETPPLYKDSLQDGISTVLGCIDFYHPTDDLASKLGAKSMSTLLTELLDVAIFLRQENCIDRLQDACAKPSVEAIAVRESMDRRHRPNDRKALKSAETNFLPRTKPHEKYA